METPVPSPPPQVWKRVGKCLVKRCDCESFARGVKFDAFEMCVCGHSQPSHTKVAANENGTVNS